MSHNSISSADEFFLSAELNQDSDGLGQASLLPKLLSGSQAKTAFAIRMNAERMMREDGLHCSGMLTLTVGDHRCAVHGVQVPHFKDHCPACKRAGKIRRMMFVGVRDAVEASRRINSVRPFLLTIFKRAILVTERHKSGAIHFHLLGSLLSRWDIRTGFDFEAVKRRKYRSVSEELRRIWKLCREKLPHYGFGRHELKPIQKTGEAIAAYVSKYIEKNVCNRTPADRRKKLVRYIGWEKNQLKPNEFEWDGPRARAWRAKTTRLFGLAGCELKDKPITVLKRIKEDCASAAGKIRPKMLDGSEIKEKFGPRWAMVGTGIWCSIFGDDKLPELEMTGQRVIDTFFELDYAESRHGKNMVDGLNLIRREENDRREVWMKWELMDEKYATWKNEKFEIPDDYYDCFKN